MINPTPNTYQERNRNPINRWINGRLDRITTKEIDRYIQAYADKPDGSRDEALAERIRYEVTRRSQMGREIDVLEPGRWTVYSFLIGIFSGGAARLTHDHLLTEHSVNGRLAQHVLKGTAITGFFGAALSGGRILSFARFKSGLYAAAQTALALNEKEMPAPIKKPVENKGEEMALQAGPTTAIHAPVNQEERVHERSAIDYLRS